MHEQHDAAPAGELARAIAEAEEALEAAEERYLANPSPLAGDGVARARTELAAAQGQRAAAIAAGESEARAAREQAQREAEARAAQLADARERHELSEACKAEREAEHEAGLALADVDADAAARLADRLREIVEAEQAKTRRASEAGAVFDAARARRRAAEDAIAARDPVYAKALAGRRSRELQEALAVATARASFATARADVLPLGAAGAGARALVAIVEARIAHAVASNRAAHARAVEIASELGETPPENRRINGALVLALLTGDTARALGAPTAGDDLPVLGHLDGRHFAGSPHLSAEEAARMVCGGATSAEIVAEAKRREDEARIARAPAVRAQRLAFILPILASGRDRGAEVTNAKIAALETEARELGATEEQLVAAAAARPASAYRTRPAAEHAGRA